MPGIEWVTPELGIRPPQIQFGRLLQQFANRPEEDFLDLQTLQAMANAYWRVYTAFIARQYLLTGPSTDLSGSVRVLHDRLVLHQLPVRFMQANLAVIVLLSCAVLWNTRSSSTSSIYPSNLVGLAAILSTSPHFRTILASFRFYKKRKDTTTSLASWTFQTRTVAWLCRRSYEVLGLLRPRHIACVWPGPWACISSSPSLLPTF